MFREILHCDQYFGLCFLNETRGPTKYIVYNFNSRLPVTEGGKTWQRYMYADLNAWAIFLKFGLVQIIPLMLSEGALLGVLWKYRFWFNEVARISGTLQEKSLHPSFKNENWKWDSTAGVLPLNPGKEYHI